MFHLFSFLLLFVGIVHSVEASASPSKKTICLNMIVKDESKVIQRCLSSLKKHIDYWVIVDTGSTDGTQKLIKDFMKDIPGELYERKWENFEHNRNEALDLARGKGDYILFIDADEQLVSTDLYAFPNLTKDYYVFSSQADNMNFHRVLLINNHPEWKWEGVVHETINNPKAQTYETLPGIYLLATPDGNRSNDPKKFAKDAAVLEKALAKDPNNSRYVFYLAQSYWSAKDYRSSLKYYEQRAAMKGWAEETFWSLYCVAKAQRVLEMDSETVINSYLKAFHFDPRRAEPLHGLATYYREKKNYFLAYLVVNYACSLPLPEVNMFSENWIYEYGALQELANNLFMLENFVEAQQVCSLILSKEHLPQEVLELAANNYRLLMTKLSP